MAWGVDSGRGRARPGSGMADGGGGRGREAWGAKNRGTGRRELAGTAPATGLCSARAGGRRERKEEEEKVPGEEGIRLCARDKADRGVEGEDRQRATRGVVGAGSRYGRRGTVEHSDEFERILLTFDRLKLKISYRNLKFGQNKSCRGRKDLQLRYWAKLDLRLELERKMRSNLAKVEYTMETQLTLMTSLGSRLVSKHEINTWGVTIY